MLQKVISKLPKANSDNSVTVFILKIATRFFFSLGNWHLKVCLFYQADAYSLLSTSMPAEWFLTPTHFSIEGVGIVIRLHVHGDPYKVHVHVHASIYMYIHPYTCTNLI